MKKIPPSLSALSIFFSCLCISLQAQTENEISNKFETHSAPLGVAKITPFTGKITKNRVRLRLQPNYEGPVLRELTRNDYVVVTGETDDFYAVQSPNDIRGYVFRSYVLDNVVEGDRVNIRLKPEREAIIVSQLKAGDRVEGKIASTNNKWLEIKLPNMIRFYIAKEYVENVGDAGFKDRLDRKRDAAYDLLNTTEVMSQAELRKPFDQMSITGIKANYQHLINDYTEFPEAINKAKDALAAVQEAYTAKKVAYLEAKSLASNTTLEANKKLSAELIAQKTKISNLEKEIEQQREIAAAVPPHVQALSSPQKMTHIPINVASWVPVEERLIHEWAQQTGRHDPQEFYDGQIDQGFILRGLIDPYTRPIKNKPGDFMLLNTASKLPIAFLYSTHINLQDYVGHEVSVLVSPRENNNFAFPAYFVLTLE
jgi:Bacterial SH3 domain